MVQKATVRASNEAELEQAFRTADRIVVEGNSTLREQAEQWAMHGPPGSIATEADGLANAPLDGEQTAPLAVAPPTPRYLWLWLLVGLLVFVLGVIGTYYLWLSDPTMRGDFPRPGGERQDSIISMVTLLVWPTVALLALCMMFLLAKRAVAAGANVRVEWKVTEKFVGTVVIEKVRSARTP